MTKNRRIRAGLTKDLANTIAARPPADAGAETRWSAIEEATVGLAFVLALGAFGYVLFALSDAFR